MPSVREPEFISQADDDGGGGQWDLRRVLTALSRRRGWVIFVVAAAVVGAVAYVNVAVRVYESRAKLLIEPQTPNVVTFKGVIEEDTAKLDYYETQLGMLKSRTLARKTLDALQLWDQPEFVETPSRLDRVVARDD